MSLTISGKSFSGYSLVWVCAWCPVTSRTPLVKGQVYTHGICTLHKNKLLLKHQAKTFKLT